MRWWCFYSFFLIVFLASCQRWQKTFSPNTQHRNYNTQQCALALLDVPLFIGAQSRLITTAWQNVVDHDDEQHVAWSNAEVIVECSALCEPQEIIQFYNNQMAHLGWQEVACSGTMFCLLFEKPDAVCLIHGDYQLMTSDSLSPAVWQSGRTIKKSGPTLFKIFRFDKYIHGGYE